MELTQCEADLRGQLEFLRDTIKTALVHLEGKKGKRSRRLAKSLERSLASTEGVNLDYKPNVKIIDPSTPLSSHLDPAEVFLLRYLQCDLGVVTGTDEYGILRSTWETARLMQYPRPRWTHGRGWCEQCKR